MASTIKIIEIFHFHGNKNMDIKENKIPEI